MKIEPLNNSFVNPVDKDTFNISVECINCNSTMAKHFLADTTQTKQTYGTNNQQFGNFPMFLLQTVPGLYEIKCWKLGDDAEEYIEPEKPHIR